MSGGLSNHDTSVSSLLCPLGHDGSRFGGFGGTHNEI